MNPQNIDNQQVVEIDLHRLFRVLLRKFWIIAIAAVLGVAIAVVATRFLITPQYESSVKFYVNNKGDVSGNQDVSSSDISTSRKLVESYMVVLRTRDTLDEVIKHISSNKSVGELNSMISTGAVNETEIFEVVVTSTDPKEAEEIANAIAVILPGRIADIIEGTSARVVEHAVVAKTPSSPNLVNNVAIGFFLAVLLSSGIIVVREIFDVTIREEEDIQQVCEHPILAAVPDMSAPSKGGYYYADGKKKNVKNTNATEKQVALIGADISFSASEAYKLLRTKLQFSFAGEKACRVIGFSSALAGEGKSLSASNLAYSMAQLDKKVLLIDCDMRRPSVAEKLSIVKTHGLSSYLSGQIKLEELIQKYRTSEEDKPFDVISAGRVPPNPGELLNSDRMRKMLDKLREQYDYIILDFPPVGEVSDAMAVAKQLDGLLVVVRQNYCNRIALSAAMRQFEFVDARILGVVYNGTSEGGAGYGKGYYRRYGKYAYYRGSHYAASAAKRVAENKSGDAQ